MSRYNAVLKKKSQFVPIATVMDIEIPDDADEERKFLIAAIKLMEKFRIELEPIEDYEGVL